MDEQKDQLALRVRKLWVRWLMLTVVGSVLAFGLILSLGNLNAAGEVEGLFGAIMLTYLLGFVLICLMSIGLGRAIVEQKGMSKSRRILLELALVIGGSLIGLATSASTCGVALLLS